MEGDWLTNVKNSEVCTGDNPTDIKLPVCLNLEQSKLMCEKLGGQMTIIKSFDIQKSLFSQLQTVTNDCLCADAIPGCDWPGVWTGYSDNVVEGRFVDVNDGQELDASLGKFSFVTGQPNGDTLENCAGAAIAMFSKQNKSWFDIKCEQRLLSFCRVNENPVMNLRGEYKRNALV